MTESVAPVYYVDIKQSKTVYPFKRAQKWYWVVLSAGSHKPMGKSWNFTNKQDCIDSATRVFGEDSSVYMRQAEAGNVLLRMAKPL